jgi:hypothetical protein
MPCRVSELTCIVAAVCCGLHIALVPFVGFILFEVGQPAFRAQFCQKILKFMICVLFDRQSKYVRRAALYVTADCPVCQPCISHVVDT